MPLTDMAVRNARGREKPYKLSDGEGMYLLVRPDGARYWRMDYALEGKRRTLAIGVYPKVKLSDARATRAQARDLIDRGIDPVQAKHHAAKQAESAAANTFKVVSDEWLQTKIIGEGKDPRTIETMNWLLRLARESVVETHGKKVDFGSRPVAEIKPSEILSILRKLEAAEKLETARRLRSVMSRVFRYAIVTDRAERDPAADLLGAIRTPKVEHRPAILVPEKFGGLLRAIDGYDGDAPTKYGLQLATLTFVRPGELRFAEWLEIKRDERLWVIPAEKMKMSRPHVVPLADQALEVLDDLYKITGDGRYLFPSVRSPSRPLSENTLNAALRRLGYTSEEVCAHGFRRTASTFLNEAGWNRDWIERQLAHVEENKVRGAYNAAEFLPDRRRMMQWWADHLDELRTKSARKQEDDELIG